MNDTHLMFLFFYIQTNFHCFSIRLWLFWTLFGKNYHGTPTGVTYISNICHSRAMGLLSDRQNCGLRMRRECRERFPRHRLQRKPLVSDPGMHRGSCVTHVPWCMSRSLTHGGGKTFPTFPAHAQPASLRIWQEAHLSIDMLNIFVARTCSWWGNSASITYAKNAMTYMGNICP